MNLTAVSVRRDTVKNCSDWFTLKSCTVDDAFSLGTEQFGCRNRKSIGDNIIVEFFRRQQRIQISQQHSTFIFSDCCACIVLGYRNKTGAYDSEQAKE